MSERTSSFNWGKGIFLALGLFAVLMVGFVIRAVVEDQPLSADNPYAESEAYGIKQQAIANAALHPIEARQQNGELHLRGTPGTRGSLVFFRPDGTHPNLKGTFALDSTGLYRLHTVGLPAGRWQLRLDYQTKGDSCYSEMPFHQAKLSQ